MTRTVCTGRCVSLLSTQVSASVSVGGALAVELLITFQLVLTVFATCDPNRRDLKGSAALAIGLSVCVGHLCAVGVLAVSPLPVKTVCT